MLPAVDVNGVLLAAAAPLQAFLGVFCALFHLSTGLPPQQHNVPVGNRQSQNLEHVHVLLPLTGAVVFSQQQPKCCARVLVCEQL